MINDSENTVFDLGEDEEVGCYFCARNGIHTSYRKGQAYLAGPGHSPCDGNANFICKRHLDEDAVVG